VNVASVTGFSIATRAVKFVVANLRPKSRCTFQEPRWPRRARALRSFAGLHYHASYRVRLKTTDDPLPRPRPHALHTGCGASLVLRMISTYLAVRTVSTYPSGNPTAHGNSGRPYGSYGTFIEARYTPRPARCVDIATKDYKSRLHRFPVASMR